MKTDMELIEELHRIDMEASKQGDFDTLLSLWTEDGVMIAPKSDPVIGKEAIASGMETYREQLKNLTITRYVIDFKEVKILGDYAFEWGMYHHVYYNNDEPDKIIEERGKVMRILRRQANGKWKVARAIWTE
ncbi:MAG: SgcJ/EcaC family oxidoreductase [Candidatus Aminicenantes bacterium]|nr:SgcJ/EcaC family oxidoreductase [Candidatus Aminicenantes bacterium]NIM80839.1 SgcJ/EcaC family oxidoreductase [Candidatus Aminicenantes bacterium]NIN20223.1 SgcJ/EcaC family oxidoreductase [Candidatus Aminicenantes bacterium]NIN44002.1 SgcJ/EcaC family oxidoreductase [Candidatus Aminicenantes bacterium]NIN86811.1 SgcJ/EcaC family oxidoreductase [Candidatus Aminicenantes bacterium]